MANLVLKSKYEEIEQQIFRELRSGGRKLAKTANGDNEDSTKNQQSQFGDIMISLDYNHSKCDFIVGVLQCENLLDANSIAKVQVCSETPAPASAPAEDETRPEDASGGGETTEGAEGEEKEKQAKQPGFTLDREDVSRVNAFVRLCLLPDLNVTKRTKVIPRSNDPQFLQRFHFRVSKSELETRRLLVTVWNQQMFGKKSFLGEAIISLQYEGFQDKVPRRYPLRTTETYSQPTVPATLAYRGEISLRVCFTTLLNSNKRPIVDENQEVDPTEKGELVVDIREARNLLNPRKGLCSTYCECSLFDVDRKEAECEEKRTETNKKNNNPRWNARMRFPDQTVEGLQKKCLQISVMEGKKKLIGGVRLNLSNVRINPTATVESPFNLPAWMDSKGDESLLWHAVTEKPNQWIEAELLLRNFIDDEFYTMDMNAPGDNIINRSEITE